MKPLFSGVADYTAKDWYDGDRIKTAVK